MSICVLCNRTFGSDAALKQHKENSPKHSPFDCTICNRSFSSQNALGQHQNDSPVHKDSRRDSVTTAVTHVPAIQHASLPSSTSPNVPSTIRNGQHSRHTTTEFFPRANPTFESSFTPIEESLQALTISDIEMVVAQPMIGRAHVLTRQKETRTWFTFPELHQRIAEAVAPAITSTWFNNDRNASSEHEHTTCVMGEFKCENKRCRKHGWSSKVVATKIRGYPYSGYSAILYNQRCKSCDWLGSFELDEESYVERIAYRLKVWAGVRVERPPFSRIRTKPHESDRCEGCKVGDCPWVEGSDSEM